MKTNLDHIEDLELIEMFIEQRCYETALDLTRHLIEKMKAEKSERSSLHGVNG